MKRLLALLLWGSTIFAQVGLAAPQGATVTPMGSTVALTWTVTLTTITTGSTGTITYNVYRGSPTCANEALVGPGINGNSWTDTMVSSGVTYCYAVRANLESVDSDQVSITIPGPVAPPPPPVLTFSQMFSKAALVELIGDPAGPINATITIPFTVNCSFDTVALVFTCSAK